jgi:hypothetical protein
MVDYKVFYKFKGRDTWRTHNFDADNDFQATQKAAEHINLTVAIQFNETVERWGLEKITTERLI